MTRTHRLGQFTWRELITSDVGKAKSFYGELFNWSFESMAGAASPYLVIKHGERAIGGITQKTPAMHFSNAWTSYVSVADVDATLALVREHGGLVYAPAKDIAKVGRFAVIADPSGAVLSIIETEAGDAPLVMPPPSSDFCWESLMTTDEEDAIPFYEAVFGWKVGPGMSGPGTQVLSCGEVYVADVQPVAAPLPSVWGTHVAVTSLEDARVRAVRLGANVLDPRIVVPKVGLVSPIIDPSGAQITLFQADESV